MSSGKVFLVLFGDCDGRWSGEGTERWTLVSNESSVCVSGVGRTLQVD